MRIKKEGFHYYNGDLGPCCGQCKHICYWNDHNELNKCHIRKDTAHLCTVTACEHFKKDPFWRFKIRVGWDKKNK